MGAEHLQIKYKNTIRLNMQSYTIRLSTVPQVSMAGPNQYNTLTNFGNALLRQYHLHNILVRFEGLPKTQRIGGTYSISYHSCFLTVITIKVISTENNIAVLSESEKRKSKIKLQSTQI